MMMLLSGRLSRDFPNGHLLCLTSFLDEFIPPPDHAGPLGRLRSRSIAMLLVLIMGVLASQTWNFATFFSTGPLLTGAAMSFIVFLLLLFYLRACGATARHCALALAAIPTATGAVDIFVGQSPVTPFLMWYPLFVFFGVTISGKRWGICLAVFFMAMSAFHLTYTAHLPEVQQVSVDAPQLAYMRRLESVLVLVTLVTCLLVHFHLYMFNQTIKDLDHLEAGKNQRKRLSTLANFGWGIAKELEKPLVMLEALSAKLQDGLKASDGPRLHELIKAMRIEVVNMSSITHRYLVLGAKPKAEADDLVSLSQIIGFIDRFHGSCGASTGLVLEPDQALDHARMPGSAGRLPVLILCSVISKIPSEPPSDPMLLKVQSADHSVVFTLNFPMASDGAQDIQETLSDFEYALEAAGAGMQLTMEEKSAKLNLRVPMVPGRV